jgi:hypothetical protein
VQRGLDLLARDRDVAVHPDVLELEVRLSALSFLRFKAHA